MNVFVEAARKRQRIALDCDAYRVFHGYTEGVPGLEVDRYGSNLVFRHRGGASSDIEPAWLALRDSLQVTGAVENCKGKLRVLPGSSAIEAETTVREGALEFLCEVSCPGNPGLYLDARHAREFLLRESHGKRVLNLFAFAGSLGVAARAGGACAVTQVDSQKRALRRCLKNHELNGQSVDHRDLVCMDVQRFLAQEARRGRAYGGVILDPPPIPKGSLRDASAQSCAGLAHRSTALLEEGGWLLCFFHHAPRSWDELEGEVMARADGRLVPFWRGTSGDDFPETDEERLLRLSAFRKVD